MSRNKAYGKLYQDEVRAVVRKVKPSYLAVYMAMVPMRDAVTMKTPVVGLSLLSELSGQCRRNVSYALTALEQAGLIERKRCRDGVIVTFTWQQAKEREAHRCAL